MTSPRPHGNAKNTNAVTYDADDIVDWFKGVVAEVGEVVPLRVRIKRERATAQSATTVFTMLCFSPPPSLGHSFLGVHDVRGRLFNPAALHHDVRVDSQGSLSSCAHPQPSRPNVRPLQHLQGKND